jgi:hypothetical protein
MEELHNSHSSSTNIMVNRSGKIRLIGHNVRVAEKNPYKTVVKTPTSTGNLNLYNPASSNNLVH